MFISPKSRSPFEFQHGWPAWCKPAQGRSEAHVMSRAKFGNELQHTLTYIIPTMLMKMLRWRGALLMLTSLVIPCGRRRMVVSSALGSAAACHARWPLASPLRPLKVAGGTARAPGTKLKGSTRTGLNVRMLTGMQWLAAHHRARPHGAKRMARCCTV